MVNKTELQNFEHRHVVYCKLVKTYVDISLCLEGGPMQKDGTCDYLVGIDKDKEGNPRSLVHAVPTQEAILKAVIREKK